MTGYGDETQPPDGKRPRKETDFREALKDRDEAELRRDLKLPDVEEILKDLQRKHGIRIGLSPKLIERLEAIKEKAEFIKDFPALKIGCMSTDICILCDQNDYCPTCDSMDWCITVDTHLV